MLYHKTMLDFIDFTIQATRICSSKQLLDRFGGFAPGVTNIQAETTKIATRVAIGRTCDAA